MASQPAPLLSTPAERLLEAVQPTYSPAGSSVLSDEQLYVQYEVRRTVDEIKRGRWRRIALQFPDEMLSHAPRVCHLLRDRLPDDQPGAPETRLTILADTSYGACCVDEVAAEHVDAEVVVHYGRSCLSPTARLPVIHVFTTKPLDTDSLLRTFATTYPAKDGKICLMADTPYHHHLDLISLRLAEQGYTSVYKTEIIHNPSSPLPNRSVPQEVLQDISLLKDYSVFHVAEPPNSLLLVLASRIKSIHIFATEAASLDTAGISTAQLLRRRYALLTRLSTVPVIGILINTLSVSQYINALEHCGNIISRAGKKSYVFVVGKLNAAKMANFSEIGGWVVIGCWESSLIENKEFYRPIVTPFELEIALTSDNERVWSGQWIADFSMLLKDKTEANEPKVDGASGDARAHVLRSNGSPVDDSSDEEPPEFDLRTGRLVSQSRPMREARRFPVNKSDGGEKDVKSEPSSSALVQRASSDIATIRGQPSPGAEFLRTMRTWRGLGSDPDILTERDQKGAVIGAVLESGREGTARGYDDEDTHERR